MKKWLVFLFLFSEIGAANEAGLITLQYPIGASCETCYVSSCFTEWRRGNRRRRSRPHIGHDISAKPNTPVLAVGDGVVQNAGGGGGYGLRVVIRHPGKKLKVVNDRGDTELNKKGYYDVAGGAIFSSYSHLAVVKVTQGQKVKKGQVIGLSDTTGQCEGPHLHFELFDGRVEQKALNPSPFINFDLRPQPHNKAKDCRLNGDDQVLIVDRPGKKMVYTQLAADGRTQLRQKQPQLAEKPEGGAQ